MDDNDTLYMYMKRSRQPFVSAFQFMDTVGAPASAIDPPQRHCLLALTAFPAMTAGLCSLPAFQRLLVCIVSGTEPSPLPSLCLSTSVAVQNKPVCTLGIFSIRTQDAYFEDLQDSACRCHPGDMRVDYIAGTDSPGITRLSVTGDATGRDAGSLL